MFLLPRWDMWDILVSRRLYIYILNPIFFRQRHGNDPRAPTSNPNGSPLGQLRSSGDWKGDIADVDDIVPYGIKTSSLSLNGCWKTPVQHTMYLWESSRFRIFTVCKIYPFQYLLCLTLAQGSEIRENPPNKKEASLAVWTCLNHWHGWIWIWNTKGAVVFSRVAKASTSCCMHIHK